MAPSFTKNRIEAFSDGVIAIIITIMVLELKVPHAADHDNKAGAALTDLAPLIPVLLSYLLSFIYVGIYWSNHHHLLHATRKVTGGVLWANLHLLFWMSLIPFVTGWVGENHFAAAPMALYGVVLLMSALAYWLLQNTILRVDGNHSVLGRALGSDFKGKLSPVLYIAAIALSYVNTWLAGALYVTVALVWLIPDRRIERAISEDQGKRTEKH
ncbi:MAG: DUF1211 domain-containing protein [Planctomycetes bacterium]|nr:DUF1211 domain-containing protein [Planctomycetota bacterium]